MLLENFVGEIPKNSRAPGGGSAAALSAAIAAALASMVAALTHSKKNYRAYQATMEAIGIKAQKIKSEMLSAVENDVAAFENVVACSQQPKANAMQRAELSRALMAANKHAMETAWTVLEKCRTVLELVHQVEQQGDHSSLRDAGVAGLLSWAAAYGAYYKLLVNLKDIEDKDWTEKQKQRADSLVMNADTLHRTIMTSVLEKLTD